MLSLLRGGIRVEQSGNSGPGVVTVSDSQLLGQNTHICDNGGNECEPDQQHVSRALEVLGLTDAKGVATPGTDGKMARSSRRSQRRR